MVINGQESGMYCMCHFRVLANWPSDSKMIRPMIPYRDSVWLTYDSMWLRSLRCKWTISATMPCTLSCWSAYAKGRLGLFGRFLKVIKEIKHKQITERHTSRIWYKAQLDHVSSMAGRRSAVAWRRKHGFDWQIPCETAWERRTRELLQSRAKLQKNTATAGHFMSTLAAPANLTAPCTFSAGSRCKKRFVHAQRRTCSSFGLQQLRWNRGIEILSELIRCYKSYRSCPASRPTSHTVGGHAQRSGEIGWGFCAWSLAVFVTRRDRSCWISIAWNWGWGDLKDEFGVVISVVLWVLWVLCFWNLLNLWIRFSQSCWRRGSWPLFFASFPSYICYTQLGIPSVQGASISDWIKVPTVQLETRILTGR